MWHQKCTIFANKFAFFFFGIFALSKFVANLLFFVQRAVFHFLHVAKHNDLFWLLFYVKDTKQKLFLALYMYQYSKLTPLVSQAFG